MIVQLKQDVPEGSSPGMSGLEILSGLIGKAHIHSTVERYLFQLDSSGSGSWRSPHTFLERETIKDVVARARAQWDQEIPGPVPLEFEVHSPRIRPYQGSSQLNDVQIMNQFEKPLDHAFYMVCRDENGKYLWLDDDGRLSGAKRDGGARLISCDRTDFEVGNLFRVTPDGTQFGMIFSDEAFADLMQQVARGQLTPPKWLVDDLHTALKAQHNRLLGNKGNQEVDVTVYELHISETGTKGLAITSVGERSVAFGVSNFGTPKIDPSCEHSLG